MILRARTPRSAVYRGRRLGIGLVGLAGSYVLLAYVIAPMLWRHYEHHPALVDAPKRPTTNAHIPGDPLNIGLIGTQAEVIRALVAAGWQPADAITFRSSAEIVESVLLHEPYAEAPVSNLYLYGRHQDLAFEKSVGGSPQQRHHVRLWRSDKVGGDGRPMWMGAATFDRSVGFSHRTGQVTHHIAPDVDAERDQLIADLRMSRQLVRLYQVTGVGATVRGRNGEGDWFYTDGEMTVGVVAPSNKAQAESPTELPSPRRVILKNRGWSWLRQILP